MFRRTEKGGRGAGALNSTLVMGSSLGLCRHSAKIELGDNLKSAWEGLKNFLKNLFSKKKSDTGVSGSSP